MSKKSVGIALILLTIFTYPFSGFGQNFFYHLLGLPSLPPFTWTGKAADNNWSTSGNWSDNIVPGASDVAKFLGAGCVGPNCNATMNVPVNIAGIDIDAAYPGTITQSSGTSVTIGSSGWTQAGGTFAGGDSNISVNGVLTLNGGAFTSTSSTLQVGIFSNISTTIFKQMPGSTFNHNSGTLKFVGNESICAYPNFTIDPDSNLTLYNVDVSGQNAGCGQGITNTVVAAGKTVTVLNNLYHTSGFIGGTWELKGNLIVGALATTYASPNAIIRFSGTGAQTYSYLGSGRTAQIEINKTSGGAVVAAAGTTDFSIQQLKLTQGSFTAPTGTLQIGASNSSGSYNIFDQAAGTTFDHNNGTVQFNAYPMSCGGVYENIHAPAGVLTFNNLAIQGSNAGCGAGWTNVTVTAGVSVKALGDMSFNGGLLDGVWETQGHFNMNSAGTMGGSGSLSLTGNTNKTITAAPGTMMGGTITVNKNSVSVTETATTDLTFNSAGQNFNISSGTVDLAGHNLVVNSALTVAASGKLICNGGTVTAGSYVLNGEVSCGTSIGITWTGLAGDNLWNTAGNWTNNTVPGSGDVALFNGMCSGPNCNVTMNVAVNVRGINITSAYSGTITQSTGISISAGAAGWTQASGTFAGGDSQITVAGKFIQSGGSFTSTSGIMNLQTDFNTTGAITFAHNSGTLTFTANNSIENFVTPGAFIYNNISILGSFAAYNIMGTMNVTGLLTVGCTYGGGCSPDWFRSGTMLASGDINFINQGFAGTTLIKVVGAGAQTITGVIGAKISNLEIAKTGGAVTFAGVLSIFGNYIYTSGTINAGTSHLRFIADNAAGNTISAGVGPIYNDVSLIGRYASYDLNASTMTVNGTFTIGNTYTAGNNWLGNGTIVANGNVVFNSFGYLGSASIKVAGSGAQTLTASAGAEIPDLEIASSGTVTLVGTLLLRQNYTYTSGTIVAGTSTLFFSPPYGATKTVVPGAAVAYNNVTFEGNVSGNTLSGTMTVNGLLTLNSYSSGPVSWINSGTILASGGVSAIGSGHGGTTLIKISGNGTQTVTGVSSALIPAFEIDTTGTVNFSGSLVFGSNYTYTAGTLNTGTSTVTFNGGPSTIVPGATAYNHVSFVSYNVTQSLTGTLNVNGNLILNGQSNSPPPYLNGGTIVVGGNVTLSGWAFNGTTNLNLVGSTSTTLSMPAPTATLSNAIIINKTGAAKVSLISHSRANTAGQDLTLSGGTLDLAGFDLSVNDVLTVDVGATLKCSGGSFTSASLVNSGTISCPGYSTYPFNWTGAGGNSNWETAGNWQGGAVPGAADVPYFEDTYCGANCNVIINSNLSIKGLTTAAAYSGTITQSAGVTITVGTKGWIQAGGTFVGGNSNITQNGNLNLTGGTYTATSATLSLLNSSLTVSGATFSHSSGTLYFSNLGSGAVVTINSGSAVLNNVTMTGDANNGSTNTIVGTMTVNGILTIDGPGSNAQSLLGGTISAKGNVVMSNNGVGQSATTLLRISGSGNQSLSGGANSAFPNLEIASTGGTVTFASNLMIKDHSFTYTSGTVDAATTLVTFYNSGYGAIVTLTPGAMTFNDVTFGGDANNGSNNTIVGTLNVNGTLNINGPGGYAIRLTGGTISAKGNVVMSANGSSSSSTTLLKISGAGNQTLSGTATANFPKTEIASTGGTVTLSGSLYFSDRNFTYTSGTVNAGTSLVTFRNYGSGAAVVLTPGAMSFNDVTMIGDKNNGSTTTLVGTMNVDGNLILSGPGSYRLPLDGGTVAAKGNVSVTGNGAVGTAGLAFVGSTTGTTLNMAGTATMTTGPISLNKSGSGSIVQTSNVSFSGGTQDLTNTAGTWDMAAFNLTVGRNISNSGTLKRGNNPTCGVITQGGSFSGSPAICP